MIKYVVGYAFTKDKDFILLMKKNKPDWQNGRLNGIGGKIEKNETPMIAMIRECKEETGLILNWKYKGIMNGYIQARHIGECHIFYSYDDNVVNFQQIEDEILTFFNPIDIIQGKYKIINNLQFLIPYGLTNGNLPFLTLTYSKGI